MTGAAFLFLGLLMLQGVYGELDYVSRGDGLHLQGDFSIAGLFPLHHKAGSSAGVPAVGLCNEGKQNKHGFHLMQAMRFAVEEINNGTGRQSLLPGVTLGYKLYDICSIPAGILATLDILEEHHSNFTPGARQDPDLDPGYSQGAVAVIGPDSSSKSFTPAALLGAYLIPQISYAASNEKLSNKGVYPTFFRTIPSDKNQVEAMIRLLVHFNWTWVALLGSDNDYGREGVQRLSQQAPRHGICIAYQGVIPSYRPDAAQTMRDMVEGILRTKVNTIVVFSSKSKLSGFLPFVVERRVTGKVWIGTEDWSTSAVISGIDGVRAIGTVLGFSVKYAAIPGLREFERRAAEAAARHSDDWEASNGSVCLHSADLHTLAREKFPPDSYDVSSSFSVYKAVYAASHALHRALGCDSGRCQRRRVDPWQLLPWLKRVRFSLGDAPVYFDRSGDPPTGYDIVTWVWRGADWSVGIVGSFSSGPVTLTLDEARIEWDATGASPSAPSSICSPGCPSGHKRLQTGQHTCCFSCVACPAATFVNASDLTECQPCPPEQWAPPRSERCLDRAVLLLAWDAPLSVALLVFLAGCLLVTSASAAVLLLNLDTPVVRSAGGRTCLLMLAALTASAMSSLCHFGRPSRLACALRLPLFVFSFTVFLACMTVRFLQVACIFKFASKLPPAYDKWAKQRGPEFTIFLVSLTVLPISVLRMALNPSLPSRDLDFYADSIVLECSNTLSPGTLLELAYVSLLSILCFFFSYLGKDLPANYNEAKSVTFSLMVYMISWMSFFTIYLISRGPFTMAAHVFAILFSVLTFLGGYFLPKIYIIVLRPQMNTTAHFQNCIQMYTMSKK